MPARPPTGPPTPLPYAIPDAPGRHLRGRGAIVGAYRRNARSAPAQAATCTAWGAAALFRHLKGSALPPPAALAWR
eukprot:12217174-Alexandrium_andersonii.AAC.1